MSDQDFVLGTTEVRTATALERGTKGTAVTDPPKSLKGAFVKPLKNNSTPGHPKLCSRACAW